MNIRKKIIKKKSCGGFIDVTKDWQVLKHSSKQNYTVTNQLLNPYSPQNQGKSTTHSDQ